MWDKNRLDRYWKLDDYDGERLWELNRMVEEAGYLVCKGASRVQLHDRLARSARGLLIYDKCTTDELQHFMAARGLPARHKRDVAIRALHRADDRLAFPKFLDLPPELRNRVYDFYFAALPNKLRPGAQAPITKTSSLVRRETLPLFYSTPTFELRFYFRAARDRHLIPANEVDLFLLKTPERNLRLLRKVQIHVFCVAYGIRYDHDDNDLLSYSYVACDLEQIHSKVTCTMDSGEGPDAKLSNPDRAFSDAIEPIVEREGFTKETIYSIERRLEKLLR